MSALVDANVLLYAQDAASPHHEAAASWLSGALAGPTRVALPWASLGAYVRISTDRRYARAPLTPSEALADVRGWLDVDGVWCPEPGPGYPALLGDLVERYHVSGALVPDAMLAALAMEHGLAVCSADSDFARFRDVRWVDPVFGRS